MLALLALHCPEIDIRDKHFVIPMVANLSRVGRSPK